MQCTKPSLAGGSLALELTCIHRTTQSLVIPLVMWVAQQILEPPSIFSGCLSDSTGIQFPKTRSHCSQICPWMAAFPLHCRIKFPLLHAAWNASSSIVPSLLASPAGLLDRPWTNSHQCSGSTNKTALFPHMQPCPHIRIVVCRTVSLLLVYTLFINFPPGRQSFPGGQRLCVCYF